MKISAGLCAILSLLWCDPFVFAQETNSTELTQRIDEWVNPLVEAGQLSGTFLAARGDRSSDYVSGCPRWIWMPLARRPPTAGSMCSGLFTVPGAHATAQVDLQALEMKL